MRGGERRAEGRGRSVGAGATTWGVGAQADAGVSGEWAGVSIARNGGRADSRPASVLCTSLLISCLSYSLPRQWRW